MPASVRSVTFSGIESSARSADQLCEHLLDLLQIAGLPILWTAAEGGRWLQPAGALLMDGICQSSWELHQSILHLGMPLCSNLPAAVVKLMLAHTPGARAVTPAAVRAHLRQNAQSAGGSCIMGDAAAPVVCNPALRLVLAQQGPLSRSLQADAVLNVQVSAMGRPMCFWSTASWMLTQGMLSLW